MKKIFLTSGVILCMACPAMATTDIAANANSSSCVNDVLGSYTGPVSFEAKWLPRVSGAITLNSDLYRSNEANATPVYTGSTSPAVSAATQTPLYSVYGVGLYTTQVTSTNYTDSTPVTTLSPKPSLTGHTFTGFYTEKASNGTQVIDGDGVVLPAALVQISTAGNTATWYAGYDPHISGAITLDSSVYPDGNANTAATYATSGTSELVTASDPTSLYSVYGVNLYSSAVTLQNYKNATPTTQITVPSKVGYNFLGFYTAKYSGGTQMINNTGVVQAAAKSQITDDNDTATWYAHWGPKNYSVTYAPGDHCSGEGRTDATGLTYDQDYEVLGLGTVVNKKSGVDVPTGYTFNGWVENISGSDTNNTRQPGYTYSPWKSDGALVLTANCTANEYKIYYNAGAHGSYDTGYTAQNNYFGPGSANGGGTYDAAWSVKTQSDAHISTNTGYTFRGWSENSAAVYGTDTLLSSGAQSGNWNKVGDMTLYAIYSANQYTITYNCGGYQDNAHSINKTASVKTTFTNAGLNSTTGVVTHTPTYDTNYTLVSVSDMCKLDGYHIVDNSWKCTVTGSNPEETVSPTTGNWTIANNVTCTVQWAPNDIDLKWYTDDVAHNGQEITGADLNVNGDASECTYDLGVNLPAQPSKDGYHFNGWKVRTNSQSGS